MGCCDRFGDERVIDTPISETGYRGRGGRRRAHGHAAGLRDAVHRLHLLRLRHPHQLRRHGALPRLPAVPDGRARAERRLRARRPVPLAEPRGRLPPHPGPQDRLPGHRARREGPASRRRSATTTACSSSSTSTCTAGSRQELPPGRSRGADRQGAAGARGQGPVDHHLRGDGVEGAGGGGAAGEGGWALGRGARPALAAPDG